MSVVEEQYEFFLRGWSEEVLVLVLVGRLAVMVMIRQPVSTRSSSSPAARRDERVGQGSDGGVGCEAG